MGEFRGYKCDRCGAIIPDSEGRTKVRTRYEGPKLNGDFTEDLCDKCTPKPEDVSLRPVKRRGRRHGEAAAAHEEPRVVPSEEQVAEDDDVVAGDVTGDVADDEADDRELVNA